MINERIKYLREKNKKTRKEIAKDLNIAYSTYSHYEIGDRELNYDLIEKIANYYNVSIDFLFGKTDYPLPVNKTELLKKLNKPLPELLKEFKFEYDGIELNDSEIDALLKLIKELKKEKM